MKETARRGSDWLNAFDRLAALDSVAYAPYRTGTNAIHAGWKARLVGQIEQVDGGFHHGEPTIAIGPGHDGRGSPRRSVPWPRCHGRLTVP